MNGFAVSRPDVLILAQVYDKRQLWLPFVMAVFPDLEIKQPKVGKWNRNKKSESIKARLQKRADARLVPMGDACHLYVPVKGIDQMVLPFRGSHKVTNAMATKLHNARYPAFERDPDGDLLSAIAEKSPHDWIKENVKGRFIVANGHRFSTVIFENEEDYILAILWGFKNIKSLKLNPI